MQTESEQILWKKPCDYQYLFLDMNAFFASCEQQEHPELRGKPVAVTPTPCPTGCVITASYEARAYGVKTGFMVRDAQKLCPKLIIRSSDTFTYLKYHKKFISIIANLTPFYQVKSIDEVLIRLSPQDQNYANSIAFANIIKNQFKLKIGSSIRASIGISANSFLAKFASERQKPDGLTMLELKNISTFFRQTKLTDFCGISYRMQNQLNRFAIYTPLDFYNQNIETLKKYFGKIGQYWYLRLHGYDMLDVFTDNPLRSLSQSHVLEPKVRRWNLAWAVCEKLIFKASRRLREEKLNTKLIWLFIKTTDRKYYKKSLKIPATCDTFSLVNYYKTMWQEIIPEFELPLKIMLVFTHLSSSKYYQHNLFVSCDKKLLLSKTLDKIHHTFGRGKILPATILKIIESAPDRISFGQPKF